jgi:hypothetical protein
MAMPAGSFGGLTFRSFAAPVVINGTGLSAPFMKAWYEVFAPLNFK